MLKVQMTRPTARLPRDGPHLYAMRDCTPSHIVEDLADFPVLATVALSWAPAYDLAVPVYQLSGRRYAFDLGKLP